MRPFEAFCGRVVALDRANVDTDAIMPKQFIKSIAKTGLGPYLFDEWRYLDRGELGQDCSTRPLNPDFVLNEAAAAGAQILLARENFGCGSSREHAVWALDDFGIRVVIAPSFADIFHGNCFKSGLLPIRLGADSVEALFALATSPSGISLRVDLVTQALHGPDDRAWPFDVDADRKNRLLLGLDDIDITLALSDRIGSYEASRKELEPWLFDVAS